MNNPNEILALMAEAVVEGNRDKAASLAARAVADRLDLHLVIENGYAAGIQKVGELWEKGEYFLPELMASAEAMKAAMTLLRPALESSRGEPSSEGKAVIGTIEGDIHDIGKNLVSSMLSANGFDVIDLGADVKLGIFIDRAVEAKVDFICLSALLTTTMLNQRRLIAMLHDRGLRGRFKVLVGGAPVTRQWAADIGADGYGENAMAAVKAAKEIMARGAKP